MGPHTYCHHSGWKETFGLLGGGYADSSEACFSVYELHFERRHETFQNPLLEGCIGMMETLDRSLL